MESILPFFLDLFPGYLGIISMVLLPELRALASLIFS